MGSPSFWVLPAARVLEEVGSSEAGLTSAEAGRRLKRPGPNELAPPRRFEAVLEIARYLANPLVLILLLASAVSAAFGQLASSIVIGLMLALSITLNFTQGYRSQVAARRLRERVGQVATVLRGGALRELPAREVVPGDVIHLAAGDLVPADGRLLAAKGLFLNEAPLTGESFPTEKRAKVERDAAAGPVEATAAVFRGTSVVSGLGVAVVVQAGYGVGDERDLTLAGFAAFLDPPREGVGETIAALRADGVEVKILTGDGDVVTQRICAEVGLAVGAVVLGDEVDRMSDPALAWSIGACAAASVLLPLTPLAPWLGFTPLPPLFLAVLVGMIASYLALVEGAKRWFYRRYAG